MALNQKNMNQIDDNIKLIKKYYMQKTTYNNLKTCYQDVVNLKV